jgi:hypothetical protein
MPSAFRETPLATTEELLWLNCRRKHMGLCFSQAPKSDAKSVDIEQNILLRTVSAQEWFPFEGEETLGSGCSHGDFKHGLQTVVPNMSRFRNRPTRREAIGPYIADEKDIAPSPELGAKDPCRITAETAICVIDGTSKQ